MAGLFALAGAGAGAPYRDNILPYNWHWFWHWGTGELGNNAVHFVDVARWGLDVDCPRRVTSSGGKFRYDDDQETPDTNVVTYEFGDKLLTFESRSWAAHTPVDPEHDIIFNGEEGSLTISESGYAIYDADGHLKTKQSADGGNNVHLQNFIDAIRDGKKQNAPIEQGVKSTLLCHLGNISWRVSRAIHMDTAAGRIIGDDEAAATLGQGVPQGMGACGLMIYGFARGQKHNREGAKDAKTDAKEKDGLVYSLLPTWHSWLFLGVLARAWSSFLSAFIREISGQFPAAIR